MNVVVIGEVFLLTYAATADNAIPIMAEREKYVGRWEGPTWLIRRSSAKHATKILGTETKNAVVYKSLSRVDQATETPRLEGKFL